MGGMKNCLQHKLNPLHLYCRLRDLGVSASTATRISSLYERLIYRLALC